MKFIELILFVALALSGIGFSGLFSYFILKNRIENEKIKEISNAVEESFSAFAKKEFMAIAGLVLAIFVLLIIFITWKIAVFFMMGALFSIFAEFIGIKIAVKTNARIAESTKESINKPLRLAFTCGTAIGLGLIGLGIIGISIMSYFAKSLFLFYGFCLGISAVTLLLRITGSVYSKASEISTKFIGKIEPEIPENSLKNSAMITDKAGSNINDTGGAGAELFENYALAIIAAMAVALVQFEGKAMMLPLALGVSGLICALIGSLAVRTKKEEKINSALRNGLFTAAILQIIASYYIIGMYTGIIGIFYAVASGIIAGIMIELATEWYTSHNFRNVKKIVNASATGVATNMLQGFAVGFESSFIPLLIIAVAIFISYYFAGTFGIAIASVSMLSTAGLNIAVSSYAASAGNAKSMADMAGLGNKAKSRTDALDLAGNATSAISKAFIICSAMITVLVLFTVYVSDANRLLSAKGSQLMNITITNPSIVIGLIIGAGLSFLFCSMMIKAVGKTAFNIIEEVRRQFKQIKGLAKGTAKADYAKCSGRAIMGSLKNTIVPIMIVVLSPIIIGFVLGVEALVGMLAGTLISGAVLTIMMTNSGSALSNARKLAWLHMNGSNKESGKESEVYNTTLTGEIVGNLLKDTCALSLSVLIKFMTIFSIVMMPLFVHFIG